MQSGLAHRPWYGSMGVGMSTESENPFRPEYFRREDESPDVLFYRQPRLVVHIDDRAIEAVGEYFSTSLPAEGIILDLMSSWRSHLPADFERERLIGLGLNGVELAENPQLDDRVLADINTVRGLPFRDNSLHAVVITVSIQYVTHPVEIFREVHRVLEDRGSFHVIYSNRMFPTKATAIWRSLDDYEHAQLINAYFAVAGGWEQPRVLDISPHPKGYSDPVYVVSARKVAE